MGAEAPPGQRDIGHTRLRHARRAGTLAGMKLGAAVWVNDTDWPSRREAVVAADAAGFDSLWCDDHRLADEGVPSAPKLEGWTVATAAHNSPRHPERDLDAAGASAEVAAILGTYADAGIGHVMSVLRPPWDLETIRRVAEVRAALGA